MKKQEVIAQSLTRRDYLITSSSAFTFFLLLFSGFPSCSQGDSFGKRLIVTKKSGSRGSPNKEWWEKVKKYDLRYINQIRYSSAKFSSRVVIDLERRADFSHNLLSDGRFYIDLKKTVLDPPKMEFSINNQTIKDIKVAQYSKEVVRLVVNLKDFKSTVNVFSLPKNKDNNERIVIDVFNSDSDIPISPVTPSRKSGEKKADASSLSRALGVKIKQVLIDPGHGGRDPGANRGNLKEKDIVLTVAKEVNKILKDKTKLETRLTRNRDKFIPLEERMAIARNWGADLFVSIHVNACPSSNRRGIETYYLSLTTDPDAMATAELENAWANVARHEIRQILSSILTKNSKIEDSRVFAGTIQQSLIHNTKQTNRGVKKAPFVVLIGADMPSILTEIGFISNRNDRKLLNDKKYLKKISQSIANGIIEYSESFSQTVRK